MANLPLAFAELLAGGIFIVAAVTGDALGDVVKGNISPQPLPGSGSGTGGGGSTAAGASTATSTPAATSTSSTGYVNPFAQAQGLVKERLDMGWDFHTSGAGQPILSIGPAKITAIIQNWYRGQPLIETQLTGGPQAGKFIYYAEGLTPNVMVGQTVAAGEQIATTTSQPTGLEFGWGGNAAGATLQQVTHQAPGDTAGQAAHSFQQFLQGLGV